MTHKWLTRLLAAPVLLGLGLLLPLSTASAQALALQTLNCTGQVVADFSPGITNTPQTISLDVTQTLGSEANPGTCLVVGSATLTGGSRHQMNPSTVLSCDDLLHSNPHESTYLWNNGLSSAINFTTNEINIVNGEYVVVNAGTVTDGFGAGDVATATDTLPTLAFTACSTPQGLTSLSGQFTLTLA